MDKYGVNEGRTEIWQGRKRAVGALCTFLLVTAAAAALASPASSGPTLESSLDLDSIVDAGKGSGSGKGNETKPSGTGDHGHAHECPPGAPKGHDCSAEPQDDFKPFDGSNDRDEVDQALGEEHAHGGDSHSHAKKSKRGTLGNEHATEEIDGKTTLEATIVGGDPAQEFQFLEIGPGEPRIVRDDLAEPQAGREDRRVSLAYLGHLTDFQVSDEESPARVEFLDITANPPFPSALSAAFRPQESVVAHGADQAIRQMNNFTADTPHSSLGSVASAFPPDPQSNRKTKRGTFGNLGDVEMEAALMTGDLADNQQKNETEWVVRLLEGGPLDPNSGIDDFSSCPGGQPPANAQLADPRNYAGVQDYSDYPAGYGGFFDQYYDPDFPDGVWSEFPRYEGLLDKAQEPFDAEGLQLPDGAPVNSYVAIGNHDGLAQGNQKAIKPFEDIGVGCIKPLVAVSNLPDLGAAISPPNIADVDPTNLMIVPPDPNRRYVDKRQFKELNATGFQADEHGFAFVDPDEEAGSNGAAGYYAFDLKPGIRMIGLDTLCEGGLTGPSAAGNIDDPQFQWLTGELATAQEANKLIVLFGHHPIRSLSCDVPDETPPSCTTDDSHDHDTNPGCDQDPRTSTPIHNGADLTALLHEYPNAIAYIAGHTHQQTLTEFDNASGGPGDFWGIETASLVDWPPQSRLVEVMDNCDGTLSIFATVLDTAAAVRAPDPDQQVPQRRSHADGFTPEDLASIGRTLAYNDYQAGPGGGGSGEAPDRNVELLLDDPRSDSTAACRQVTDPDPTDPKDPKDPDTDPEDSDAADDPDGGGSLPVTGFILGGLVLTGLAMLTSGGVLRRFRPKG